MYRVLWLGYGHKDDTWEPVEHVKHLLNDSYVKQLKTYAFYDVFFLEYALKFPNFCFMFVHLFSNRMKIIYKSKRWCEMSMTDK